jgi:hypothetical protein
VADHKSQCQIETGFRLQEALLSFGICHPKMFQIFGSQSILSGVKFGVLPGLAVLNAHGRDTDVSFEQEIPSPDTIGHAPINYHAYAACTHGGFYRTPELAARHRNVLLLLRSDLKDALKAFRILKNRGCFVAISFKESGLHQVAHLLKKPGVYERFRELGSTADLCLSSTPDLLPLYATTSRHVAHIATPYPIDLSNWNFAIPLAERSGLLIGTREFDVPSRNHLLALAIARKWSEPVTVINPDGGKSLRYIEMLGFPSDQLRIETKLDYPNYLRLIARHKIIFQLDQSSVPGQVAGDGLLCRVPTVGGNGAVERLAFPALNGLTRSFSELIEIATKMLRDPYYYEEQLEAMKKNATTHLSFTEIRKRLADYFPGILTQLKET